MEVNKNFVLRTIADENMLVPVGEQTIVTNGMIRLSPVAALIWQKLYDGAEMEEVLAAVQETYEIDADTARTDLNEFIEQMKKVGLLG